MLIKLHSNLFEDDSSLQDINYLLSMFSDRGRYDYFCEFSEIKDRTTFLELQTTEREIAEQHYIRCIQENLIHDYSISKNSSDTDFDIIEAKRFFSQPFIIILENSFNDGHFVDVLISVFEEGLEIKRQKENGWVEYGNAGGCDNIKNIIDARKKMFLNLPKDSSKYLRLFVLIDSDKKHPEDDSRQSRTNLKNYLVENNVVFHILQKREMENYIPNEVLQIEGNDLYINSYKTLSSIQKDYFDLYKGFANEDKINLEEAVSSLFEDVSDETYQLLRKPLKFVKFKSKTPKLFENATKEQLKRRTAHQKNTRELEDILNKISELL